MTEIRFRVPRVPAGLVANMLGLAGVIAMVVAVGGLTGDPWWSVLAGGVAAVSLAAVAQTQATPANRPAGKPALTQVPRAS